MELADLLLEVLETRTKGAAWTLMIDPRGAAKIVGITEPASQEDMAKVRALALTVLRDAGMPLAAEENLVVVGKDDALGKAAWQAICSVD
jgi:hypothetical protein